MKKYDLLPFEVTQAATGGDSEAMNRIMRHYSAYIAKLCMHRVYDEAGQQHYIVDEAMRGELEAKLTAAVLRFKVA